MNKTHSLFAVPIVRNHLAVVELTLRSKCVYTRHPDLCHATSGVLTSRPPEHANWLTNTPILFYKPNYFDRLL